MAEVTTGAHWRAPQSKKLPPSREDSIPGDSDLELVAARTEFGPSSSPPPVQCHGLSRQESQGTPRGRDPLAKVTPYVLVPTAAWVERIKQFVPHALRLTSPHSLAMIDATTTASVHQASVNPRVNLTPYGDIDTYFAVGRPPLNLGFMTPTSRTVKATPPSRCRQCAVVWKMFLRQILNRKTTAESATMHRHQLGQNSLSLSCHVVADRNRYRRTTANHVQRCGSST
jgi:hypothetical protein